MSKVFNLVVDREEMLHGKMSRRRGPDNDENAHFPPIITSARSRQESGEFPIGNHNHNDQMLSSILHKQIHPYPMSKPGSERWDEKKGIGWKERMDDWKLSQGNLGPGLEPDEVIDPDMAMLGEARQPLSRKVPIASSKVNPYQMIIVIRLIVLAFFLCYRPMNIVHDAFGLWFTSVIYEI